MLKSFVCLSLMGILMWNSPVFGGMFERMREDWECMKQARALIRQDRPALEALKKDRKAKHSTYKFWGCREALEFYNQVENKDKYLTLDCPPTTVPIFIYKVIIAE